MCPHTVHAAGARSWHCMRSASVLPTRPACRLPRSVPAPVATATTRARARHGHNQPEAAFPISVLNLIALSWESWLIRPPDTREIPSSSLGESTPPLDLAESFCPLFFFLTAARSAFLVVARPGFPKISPPLVFQKFFVRSHPALVPCSLHGLQPPTFSCCEAMRCSHPHTGPHVKQRQQGFWIAMASSNQHPCDVGPSLGLLFVPVSFVA